jgi:uncharacterized membrane protein
MTVYRYLFLGLIITALAQVFYYYPRLPQVVASHFDGTGAANGWSSRNLFFAIYLAMIGLVFAVFVLVPRWLVNRDSFSLKIPNRDYWLAPERLAQTREFFCRNMMLMGVLHLLLTMVTIQLAILANLGQNPRLDTGIYWALGLYFVFLIAWLLNFHMHFRKP